VAGRYQAATAAQSSESRHSSKSRQWAAVGPQTELRPTNSFSADGLFDSASDSIFLNRVISLGGSEHFIRSAMIHEIADFARAKGNFLPGAALEGGFRRTLAHSNRLRLMKTPLTRFRSLIGDPHPNAEVASLADLYNEIYRDHPQKQEMISRETVSHAIQLYHALKEQGHPGLREFEPVKRDIEAFLSGEHRGSLMSKPVVPLTTIPRRSSF
jgi:hypothetical protein